VSQRFDDDMPEPSGPEYDRLSELARMSRPVAPADLVDRVMRAVRAEALEDIRPSIRERIRSMFDIPLVRGAGVLALAALAVVITTLGLHFTNGPEKQNRVRSDEIVLHRFEFTAPEAREVCLVGDFNAWEVCRMPLQKNPETGQWVLEVPLSPGRHEYMFVVDKEAWVTDPTAPAQVDDGFGNQNAVVFL
jgi:hypothetical protein